MKTYQKSSMVIAICVTAFITMCLSVLGVRFAQSTHPLHRDLAQLRELREVISVHYIGEQEEAVLTHAALVATVNALGDTWSRYLTQAQFEEHLRRMGNQQQGLGISFSRDEESGEIVILAVSPNSPAYHAGLVPGDTMITVGAHNTIDLEDGEVRDVVLAHYGQSLRLYLRNVAGETRVAYAEIGRFYINPVYYELLEDNIGYIQIINFDLRSGNETIAAIESLYASGVEALVFDLRYNPGGRVDELLQILDYLLPAGEIFVFEDQRGSEIIHRSGADYFSIPMVVLINESSFSAAEFFAAILQEEQRAYIVGLPTSGKSRSQQLFPLPSGGAVALSTRRYLTPARVDLYEAGGVHPDFHVYPGEVGEDLQLEKAIRLLQGD